MRMRKGEGEVEGERRWGRGLVEMGKGKVLVEMGEGEGVGGNGRRGGGVGAAGQ